jgi:hypothetical protein
MHAAGRPLAPQLVLDELVRRGVARGVHSTLADATTSGAAGAAVRDYAAAVLATSLRRRVESLGHALQSAAKEAGEAQLANLITSGATACAGIATRLHQARGGIV